MRELESPHSSQVQEIIGHPPPWLVRWGSGVVLAGFALLVVGTALLRYPDTVTARIRITTASPPGRVVARASGRIARLFVSENVMVRKGDYLVALDSSVPVSELLRLKEHLRDSRSPGWTPDPDLELGELQAAYAELVKKSSDVALFGTESFRKEKAVRARRAGDYYEDVHRRLLEQRELQRSGAALALRTLELQRALQKERLLAEADILQAESAYLDKKLAAERVEADILANRARIEQAGRDTLDVEQERHDKSQELILARDEAVKRLEGAIAEWEQRFLLRAPMDGKVWFLRFWSENQTVREGDEVVVIVPGSEGLIGKMDLPQLNSGKVRVGQKVNIRCDSYPFGEVGMVRGVVESISGASREGDYLVNVRLPDGLKTTYGAVLKFLPEMQGTADIVSEDLSLLQRIFYRLRSTFGPAS